MPRWRGELETEPAEEKPSAYEVRQALRALEALYQEIDALLVGVRCDRCGRCCELTRTRFEPFLLPLEVLGIEAGLERAGRTRPPPSPEGHCPFLENGRCSIYESRAFGCRTYFCAKAVGMGDAKTRKIAALMTRLTELSDRIAPFGKPRTMLALFGAQPESD